MGFNRSNLNLGNQFSHAADVASGNAYENESRSRDYYHIPKGIKRHKWGAKEERFNILLAKNKATDPDDTGYKFYRAVPVHELPNLVDPKHPHRYPCPRLINQPCPCCNKKEQLDDGTKGGENWERIKPFIPKNRVLYYLNPEGTNEILLHECAEKQKGDAAFPQRLMAQATAMSEGSMPIPFASPNEDGKIVKVNTSKDTFGGSEYYSASAVNFFPRKELPADELYERCVPWNEILNFGTAEEMERVMNGGEPDPLPESQGAAGTREYTEEEKQAEFERACEASYQPNNAAPASQGVPHGFQQSTAGGFQSTPAQQPAQGFQASPNNGFQQAPAQGFQSTPASGPLTEADFRADPYSAPSRNFPSESAQPTQGSGCPHGLRLGVDFETSRKCCNCENYENCRNARRNG